MKNEDINIWVYVIIAIILTSSFWFGIGSQFIEYKVYRQCAKYLPKENYTEEFPSILSRDLSFNNESLLSK